MAFIGEVNRGNAKVCSRNCYYKYQKRIIPTGDRSWAWKGEKAGISAIHRWVEKNLGKPEKCEYCKEIKAKIYEWANISQKYKRELKDWIRLCRKCHAKFDYKRKVKKWRASVKKLGWKIKDIPF